MKPDVLIARIRKAHGIRGEVIAALHTFNPERFGLLQTVYVGDELRPMTIEKWRNAHLGLIIKFTEITSRNDAETLKGKGIYIKTEDRLPLPDDEAYLDELVGMTVVDDVSDLMIGKIDSVIELPSGNIFIVAMTGGDERLIHRNSPEFVRIERSKQRVRVSLMEVI